MCSSHHPCILGTHSNLQVGKKTCNFFINKCHYVTLPVFMGLSRTSKCHKIPLKCHYWSITFTLSKDSSSSSKAMLLRCQRIAPIVQRLCFFVASHLEPSKDRSGVVFEWYFVVFMSLLEKSYHIDNQLFNVYSGIVTFF